MSNSEVLLNLPLEGAGGGPNIKSENGTGSAGVNGRKRTEPNGSIMKPEVKKKKSNKENISTESEPTRISRRLQDKAYKVSKNFGRESCKIVPTCESQRKIFILAN